MGPACVPVAFLCVAPSYVGAVSELEAMRIAPPPGVPDSRPPLHEPDPAAVERLSARITAFSGDLIFTLTPTARNTFCAEADCVVTGGSEGSNTHISLGVAMWRRGGGEARAFQSVEIKARTPQTYRAAVAAVAVCPRPGACIPLRRLLRGRNRTSEETSFD
jgi:hypothetical protein